MKKLILYPIALISCITFLSFSAFKLNEKIKGWFLAGSSPQSYLIGVETNSERSSKVAFLKSVKESKGFGTLMQGFYPNKYLGKRVRMSGFIKSKDVADWAGMWFRIDGEDKKALGFDNMQSRPIKGNQEWKKYSIVLDVPSNSKYFAYGVLLSGEGQIWMDDVSFEVVDATISTTAPSNEKPVYDNPENLNFELTGN
ncbi:MAG: hypothetical protein ACO1N7_04830 [Sphingobacteriaceae bacterium]